MEPFFTSPFWGIFLTVAAFTVGEFLYRNTNKLFVFQPLFVATIIGVLTIYLVSQLTGQTISQAYADYKHGADIIFWFIGPATISFAVPLYKKRNILYKFFIEIFASLTIGILISITVVYLLSKVLGLTKISTGAMMPQAATTAIAMPISSIIGGGGAAGKAAASITAVTVILNSVIIAALGSQFIKWFHLEKNPVGMGLGFGTAGHTIGSATALTYGETQGAMAAVAVVVVGLVVDIVAPFFAHLVHFM
ncbi:holin-like protein LrgB [Weissella uvarum]|uniref:LrgB family protein n=1 Tax=Weissella uvarum TaxID=1479233 RepID=UPI001961C2C8|nr:LrgB family protein [Weissella uvarum]MBM7616571.1 holin-like protein LrgB [Weissella uvarum]MCM0594969.1 LrgB family protein [Weissella uvarum]